MEPRRLWACRPLFPQGLVATWCVFTARWNLESGAFLPKLQSGYCKQVQLVAGEEIARADFDPQRVLDPEPSSVEGNPDRPDGSQRG